MTTFSVGDSYFASGRSQRMEEEDDDDHVDEESLLL
jgi:hypothetical protein